MLGVTDTPLTLAGFIAISMLLVTVIGLTVSILSRMGSLSERLARLEERIRKNGGNV